KCGSCGVILILPPAEDAAGRDVRHFDEDIGKPRVRPPACGRPSIPGYELTRFLASSKMGVVYLARDSRVQREVALKVIWPPDAATARYFLREARAMAAVTIPVSADLSRSGRATDVPFWRWSTSRDLDSRMYSTEPRLYHRAKRSATRSRSPRP